MSHDESAALGGTAEGVQSSQFQAFQRHVSLTPPHSELIFAIFHKLSVCSFSLFNILFLFHEPLLHIPSPYQFSLYVLL